MGLQSARQSLGAGKGQLSGIPGSGCSFGGEVNLHQRQNKIYEVVRFSVFFHCSHPTPSAQEEILLLGSASNSSLACAEKWKEAGEAELI